jgi:hypothetical protein
MKKSLGIIAIALVGAATISLTACRDNEETPQPPAPDIPVTDIELNESSFTMQIDGERTLTATLTPADATDKRVTWTSSDPAVVAIEPDGLTCKLTALTAGGPVTITVRTEDGAFEDTCEVTVEAGQDETVIDSGTAGPLTWTFTNDGTLTISGTGAMPDYDYDYTDNQSTTPWDEHLGNMLKLVVEEGVTGIGKYAFSHTGFLADVSLPNSLTIIGEHAFSYSGVLQEIALPNGVTAIADNTFLNCYALVDVTLPGSLVSIGYMAFYNCMALPAITLPNTVTSIGNSCFGGCSYMTEFTIPEGITTIGSNTFNTCSSLARITIPNSVTSIGTAAFFYCGALTGIDLPDNLATIGDEVFMGCTGLTSITIPATVTSIGGMAFFNCAALTEMTILADAPPTLGFNPVSDYTTVTVYVHAASLATYKADPSWSQFTKIAVIPSEVPLEIFHSAEGYYWEPHWTDPTMGDFSLNMWSYPVDNFGTPTGEGYRLEMSLLSSIPSGDQLEFAVGDYTVSGSPAAMTIQATGNINMPPNGRYVGPNAATSEDIYIVGGTMKIEGTPANYTITIDFTIKNADGEERPLKGKFEGVIAKMSF